jgi:type I restriction enzyme S subunit
MTEYVELGKVANVTKLAGFEFTKHFEYNTTGEIIALRAKNIRNGRLDLSDIHRIDKDVSDELPRSQLHKDDIIFTYTGNGFGDCALIPQSGRFHLAPNIAKITPESIDPYFLFKYMKSDEFYQQVENFMVGSSQPTIPMATVRKLLVPNIGLLTQRAIAEVLSSIDDKIDLLTRQNTTLEALAQTYFRQWFVESANEDWDEIGLDQIADFLNGLALQNYPCKTGEPMLVIKIKELNNGYSDSSDICSPAIPEKYIVHTGDVVFSWSGSLAVDIWKYGEGALNQHLFKVTSADYPKWFYYYWIKHHLTEFRSIAESKATTMGHIQRGHLSAAKVLVPTNLEIEEMSKTMCPLIDKVERNNAQIMTLQKLRDTLLPKLISGEVRVKQ